MLSGLALALAACASPPANGPGPILEPFGLSPAVSNRASALMFAPGCPPAAWDRAKLEALKAAGFEIADAGERETFAREITACLGSPDPAVRDGIAFEALSHMLRGAQLSDAIKRTLLTDLTRMLGEPDPLGVRQPFAALALSEVARADRIATFLTDDERAKLLVDAQFWFINISDYRGFSETEGWRHAVAHGSDLLMQLALNPRIDAEGLRVIVSAIGVQVAPKGHAYIHGENERLARPILFAAARGALSEQDWSDWLVLLATPKDAGKVFTTEEGQAWRHDVQAFLQALYVNVTVGGDPKDDVLKPGLEAALKAIP